METENLESAIREAEAAWFKAQALSIQAQRQEDLALVNLRDLRRRHFNKMKADERL